MTYAVVRQFEIARGLIRMTGVLSRNFLVLAVLALVLSGIPNLIILEILGSGFLSDLKAVGTGLFYFGQLFSLLIGALLQAALIHATISDLNGGRAGIGDCLNTAVRHVLPLVGIGIATTVAAVLGLFLFIVPGVILALALCVSAPVRVVEGLGVFASLSRSGDLTRGHRGAILLLFVLYSGGSMAIEGWARQIGSGVYFVSHPAWNLLGPLIVVSLAQALGALIGAAGVASIYFELRTAKEGVSIEALAAAFD